MITTEYSVYIKLYTLVLNIRVVGGDDHKCVGLKKKLF